MKNIQIQVGWVEERNPTKDIRMLNPTLEDAPEACDTMSQISNGLGIGDWILFVICYLVLGIFNLQRLKLTRISRTPILVFLGDTTPANFRSQ